MTLDDVKNYLKEKLDQKAITVDERERSGFIFASYIVQGYLDELKIKEFQSRNMTKLDKPECYLNKERGDLLIIYYGCNRPDARGWTEISYEAYNVLTDVKRG